MYFLLAEIDKPVWQLESDLVVDTSAYANRTWLGKLLKPCGYVDAVSIDGTLILNHIAQINPNTELHTLIVWNVGVVVRKPGLHLDSALHRIDDAEKLYK